MKEEIQKQTIPVKKVTDQLGRIHVFKMVTRAEREFYIQAISSETGAILTPALSVTGPYMMGNQLEI
jgi:hypothetical protein